jgi:hypothetical protein
MEEKALYFTIFIIYANDGISRLLLLLFDCRGALPGPKMCVGRITITTGEFF